MTIWDFLDSLIKNDTNSSAWFIIFVLLIVICLIFKYFFEAIAAIAAFANRKK